MDDNLFFCFARIFKLHLGPLKTKFESWIPAIFLGFKFESWIPPLMKIESWIPTLKFESQHDNKPKYLSLIWLLHWDWPYYDHTRPYILAMLMLLLNTKHEPMIIKIRCLASLGITAPTSVSFLVSVISLDFYVYATLSSSRKLKWDMTSVCVCVSNQIQWYASDQRMFGRQIYTTSYPTSKRLTIRNPNIYLSPQLKEDVQDSRESPMLNSGWKTKRGLNNK